MKKGFSLPVAMVGVFTFWIIAAFAIKASFDEWPERGQFGDMFGALNSLFSALGFVALVWTLRLQQIEMEEARKDKKAADAVRAKEMEFYDAQISALTKTLKLQEAAFTSDRMPILKWHIPSFGGTFLSTSFSNSGGTFQITRIDVNLPGGEAKFSTGLITKGGSGSLGLSSNRAIPKLFTFQMFVESDVGPLRQTYEVRIGASPALLETVMHK